MYYEPSRAVVFATRSRLTAEFDVTGALTLAAEPTGSSIAWSLIS